MSDNVLFIDWANYTDLAHDRGRYVRWLMWQNIVMLSSSALDRLCS